jgi:alpha,alpha-trehalase
VATTLDTGQQWDAPPLQWIAAEGLSSYGQNRLAETIACRWMVNVSRVYRQTGKLAAPVPHGNGPGAAS